MKFHCTDLHVAVSYIIFELYLQTIKTVLYRDQGGLGFSIAGGRGSVPFKGNDNVSIMWLS